MIFNRLNLLRAAGAVALAMVAAGASQAAQADVVFDNLGSSQDFSEPAFGSSPLAQSFNSGSGGALDDIKLLLTSSTGLNPTGSLEVSLVANGATGPGSQIISLGSLMNSAVKAGSTGVFDFAPLAGTVLDAGTTYWIEISETTANGIEWLGSQDISGTGVDGSSFFDPDFGVTAAEDFGAFQMAVDVPEPETLTLLLGSLLGLGLVARQRRAQ
ncbi:MAG TPA: choice-of-anchor R domain-containing protein [Aliidongia sp.]|nr:choice-of-anchor R domain-containing protein [Aliidongia sp.]